LTESIFKLTFFSQDSPNLDNETIFRDENMKYPKNWLKAKELGRSPINSEIPRYTQGY